MEESFHSLLPKNLWKAKETLSTTQPLCLNITMYRFYSFQMNSVTVCVSNNSALWVPNSIPNLSVFAP